jgi:hypothetical protein
LNGGTANGVAYLNGSKVLTTGSELTTNGSTNLTVPAEVNRTSQTSYVRLAGGDISDLGANVLAFGPSHASAPGRLSLSAAGAGTINFGIAGSEQMRLTSTGLGIGTSSPTVKLDVSGTAANIARFISSGATTSLALDNTNANAWGSNLGIFTGGTAAGYFGTIGSLLGTTTQDLAVYATAGNGFRVYTNGNNERMRLDSSGNLGIGTSSPVYRTQIYGSGQTTAALTDAGNKGGSLLLNTPTVAGGDGGALLFGAGGGGAKPFAAIKGLLADGGGNTIGALAFSTRNATGDTALTERMRLDSSGNLGLGSTSNPSTRRLSVNGIISVQDGSNERFFINWVPGQSRTEIVTVGANSTTFWTNSVERARITSDGELLVGGTSAVVSSKFLSQFDGNTYNGAILNETANATGTTFLGFALSGTVIGSVARVGATSAVIYNTTSDQRLKSNIQTAAPVLEKLMQVQVRQYDWTVGDLHQEYGFVAQELEPVLSGVVTKGKTEEDMWQLDYSRLTPHLVKAIQELKAEFDAYKASHP